MKKKNVAYILFGLAGNDVLFGLIFYFIYPRIFEYAGIPPLQRKIMLGGLIIETILVVIILACVGVIFLIKYRKEPETRGENL